MTREELQKFCGYQKGMDRPWSFCVHSYATNGYILIQVPRLDEIEENPLAPNLTNILLDPKPSTYLPLSEYDLRIPRPCFNCEGGKEKPYCLECNGIGDVTLENDYHSYTFECKTCQGSGEVEKCEKCHGTGIIEPKQGIEIAGAFFAVKALRLLKSLPGCEIGPTGEMTPAWFKFDGGDGLIMPRRK